MTEIPISSVSRAAEPHLLIRSSTTQADGAFGRTLTAALDIKGQVISTPPVNPFLLSEIERQEGARRDRQSGRRGQALLDALSALQRVTLGSDDPGAFLEHMKALLADMPQAADPGLASVVKEIAVRAAVEIARREVTA